MKIFIIVDTIDLATTVVDTRAFHKREEAIERLEQYVKNEYPAARRIDEEAFDIMGRDGTIEIKETYCPKLPTFEALGGLGGSIFSVPIMLETAEECMIFLKEVFL